MQKIKFTITLSLLCLMVNTVRADNLKNWDDFSTVLAVGLPGIALYSLGIIEIWRVLVSSRCHRLGQSLSLKLLKVSTTRHDQTALEMTVFRPCILL